MISLPPALRNRIYQYHSAIAKPLAIRLTCRQIKHEYDALILRETAVRLEAAREGFGKKPSFVINDPQLFTSLHTLALTVHMTSSLPKTSTFSALLRFILTDPLPHVRNIIIYSAIPPNTTTVHTSEVRDREISRISALCTLVHAYYETSQRHRILVKIPRPYGIETMLVSTRLSDEM
jgi:hypothetical protein